ncbi:unknown [Gryllus bimaculatus nudivirus]|uniref:Uncharacterized protein n=1 Tax=Gryllus bimaculatus nudivirus TaxID=432587 RepID=A4L239_9VIRU|nr:hypothetical protein GrBNV_gp76 [Gryllus bimaculatus nudivirus]ABO45409.1 unknown [Gryllus bimaculatus nudivirus]
METQVFELPYLFSDNNVPPEEYEQYEQNKSVIWDTFRFLKPSVRFTNPLQYVTSAILFQANIDKILCAKILKYLPHIIEFFKINKNDTTEIKFQTLIGLITNDDLKERILNFTNSVGLEKNDIITISRKKIIFTTFPQKIKEYKKNIVIEKAYVKINSLFDFEHTIFSKNITFKYYENVNFAFYIYMNLMNDLGIKDDSELLLFNSWKSKLALLLVQTNFDNKVAVSAFRNNTVTYKGVVYDTSFVPKYNVQDIRPIQRNMTNPINVQNMISYRNQLNVRTTKKIDLKYLPFFYTFPFKDGHLIKSDGQIVFMNVPEPTNYVKRIISSSLSICSLDNVEELVKYVIERLSISEIISTAVNSNSLSEQALALLALWFIRGSYMYINYIKINLPSLTNLLKWNLCLFTPDMSNVSIILPPLYNNIYKNSYFELNVKLYTNLVKHIASIAQSAIAVCILCSKYKIPEIVITHVYNNLDENLGKKNTTQLFVFFTLLIQENYNFIYINARNLLKPTFDTKVTNTGILLPEEIEVYQYYNIQVPNIEPFKKNSSPYVDKTWKQMLNESSLKIFALGDIGSAKIDCVLDECLSLPDQTTKLDFLAKNNYCPLNNLEIAAFITLSVQ